MNIIPVTKPTRFPRRYFSLSTRWCFFKIWKKIKSQPKRQTLPLCHREAKVPKVRSKEQHIRVDQNGTYRVGLGEEEWETIDWYTKLWTYKSDRRICKHYHKPMMINNLGKSVESWLSASCLPTFCFLKQ